MGSTKELVNQVKAFISEGKEPAIPRSSLYKFKSRYGDGIYEVKDGKLLHNSKIVVPKEEAEEILMRLFQDFLLFSFSVYSNL
jgi:hypothetical protein